MNATMRQTSGLAIASLIFGILGWTLLPFIGSVVAVITGHMGRGQIRRNRATLEGDGLAIAGLVLGWASLALWLIGIFVVIFFLGGLAWLGYSSM